MNYNTVLVLQEMKGLARALLAESILGLLLMQFNSLIVQFSNQPSLNLKKGMNHNTVLEFS